ncbi:Ig-like domain-containing protein [Leptospira sp. WS39.C2]
MKQLIRLKVISILLCVFGSVGNCYFNPFVNGLLNPEEVTDQNSFLGLLGFGFGTTGLQITGQIRDANGVAIEGLGLSPNTSFSQTKSNLPYTTDTGGRFYIPFQFGRFSYQVYQNGSLYFTLILNVSSATSISAETIGAPIGLEISNLSAYNVSSPPSFFELVRVYTIQGDDPPVEVNLHNQNAFNVNYLHLVFSESPESIPVDEGAVESWVASNITVNPPINLEAINSEITSGNTRQLGYAFPFGGDTLYTVTFGSGIKSAAGKNLTPRTIVFCMEPNVNCGF